MDTLDRITTKVEVREFSEKPVPAEVKLRVLEAARMTGSSMNTQHWRFIVLQGEDEVGRLADVSRTGPWVRGANFAVLIVADPKVSGHMIDVGRAVQDMQLAAWDQGVGSGIFTGFQPGVKKQFGIPEEMVAAAALGFGYAAKAVTGKRKNRKPLTQVAFAGRFGERFDPARDLK